MGVCMGACAKMEKGGDEIAATEQKQIEDNLKVDPFEGDGCNYQTASGDIHHNQEIAK